MGVGHISELCGAYIDPTSESCAAQVAAGGGRGRPGPEPDTGPGPVLGPLLHPNLASSCWVIMLPPNILHDSSASGL
jgi:hypothetical protein